MIKKHLKRKMILPHQSKQEEAQQKFEPVPSKPKKDRIQNIAEMVQTKKNSNTINKSLRAIMQVVQATLAFINFVISKNKRT